MEALEPAVSSALLRMARTCHFYSNLVVVCRHSVDQLRRTIENLLYPSGGNSSWRARINGIELSIVRQPGDPVELRRNCNQKLFTLINL
jgi:hypothetical protein